MKTARTFRLSEQASQGLKFMAEQTGSSETAMVEQAIFFYSQMVAKTVQGRQRSLDWQAARKRREEEAKEPTESDLNSKMEQVEYNEYQEDLKRFPALKRMYASVPNHPKKKKRRQRK